MREFRIQSVVGDHFSDPRQWTENHVAHWLQWAVKEFSLECIPLHQFRMKGKDICAMGKDAFAARAPAFVGDILWEHLEQLQKGRANHKDFPDVEKERSLPIVGANIYNSMCVPDLNFLDYQGSMLPGEDRKPITITPVPNTTPTPAAPNNNNFLHDVIKLPSLLTIFSEEKNSFCARGRPDLSTTFRELRVLFFW
ncbi:hypothetical protein GEV33_009367 [Tenebrio molitor]|uniref:PNT domain-containing protein n=1 Tax=Tenebrio molitor TaxID=7067 RepID=A0A8J6HFW1_TENMO|nr:hypothetical protein GEV33_009367 [Tenebrio molitor]